MHVDTRNCDKLSQHTECRGYVCWWLCRAHTPCGVAPGACVMQPEHISDILVLFKKGVLDFEIW